MTNERQRFMTSLEIALFDNDLTPALVSTILWQNGMEIVQRLSDGMLIMWQLGDYSMWSEVMEDGYLLGYRFEGELDGYEDDLE